MDSMIRDPSFDYETYAYQLMKIKLTPGVEYDLCFMFLDYCCEHQDYNYNVGQLTQVKFLFKNIIKYASS